MQCNKLSLKNNRIVFVVVITLFTFISTLTVAAPLSYHTYDDVEIYPLPDVNVTPIYDGNELKEING